MTAQAVTPSLNQPLAELDPDIAGVLTGELARQREPEDGVPAAGQGVEDGGIGLGARVRLDVGPLGVEDRPGPLEC